MNSNRLIPAASMLLAATTLGACDRTDRDRDALSPPAPVVSAAKSPQDVEVNAPLSHRDIDLVFSTKGVPTYDPTTDTLSYTVTIANNGKAVVASKGAYPVNIGVVILGSDGTLATPPARQDFVRIRLPHELSPGQGVDLAVKFKVEPTLGGTVIVDAVQERVAWFRGYRKPVLTLGSFTRCADDPQSVCTGDGTRIAEAR